MRRKNPPGRDMRKQSVYLTAEVLAAMLAEAKRQDRSLSWLVNQAWHLAAAELSTAPTVESIK